MQYGIGVLMGLVTQPSRRGPALSAPNFFPANLIQRLVSFDPDDWAELKEIAEFHSDVFKKMGADQNASRQDMHAALMKWAIDEYWKDKGGKPTSKADWAEKAEKFSHRLKKKWEEALAEEAAKKKEQEKR